MIHAVSLHGVTIAWSTDGLAIDPLARVIAIESAEPAIDPEAPSITFALRSAGESAGRDPRDEGWEPSFFHGIVQAYRRGDAFLLWDRASRAVLSEARVEAEIAPADREVTRGSAGAMLEIALALSLRRHGLFHMHAAALSLPSGAPAIVVGGSGSGKTTTTLALLEAGARYLGDDALFLVAEAHGVRAAAFPRAFHLGPATLSAFPRLAGLAGPIGGHNDKRPLDPRVAFPDRRITSLSLDEGRVVAIFPRIVSEASTVIEALPRAEAFGLFLASSAALVIEGLAGRDENLAILRSLLAASRCFELRLGRDALVDPRDTVAARVAERSAS